MFKDCIHVQVIQVLVIVVTLYRPENPLPNERPFTNYVAIHMPSPTTPMVYVTSQLALFIQ